MNPINSNICLSLSLFIITACNNGSPKPKSGVKSTSVLPSDSSQHLSYNFKRFYPSLFLSIDTVSGDQHFRTLDTRIDTFDCHSFKRDRDYLGKLSNVVAVAAGNGLTQYFRTGSIKLWVCKTDRLNTVPGDTLIISGLVFDILGDEKVSGFPVILSKIAKKTD